MFRDPIFRLLLRAGGFIATAMSAVYFLLLLLGTVAAFFVTALLVGGLVHVGHRLARHGSHGAGHLSLPLLQSRRRRRRAARPQPRQQA